MVPLKSFNHQSIYVGRPGSGKSYAARRAAWKLAQSVGAYVIAHDPTGSFDGDRAVPHRRHANSQALARGLAQLGGRVVHILEVPDADTVLACGIHVAAASMAQAKGSRYSPVIVLVDEVVTAGGLDSHGLSPMWRDAIARRRHLGIGIVLTSQSAFFAHRSVMTLATEIHVFALADPADADRLVKVGLNPELGPTLRALPDRAHYVIRNGQTSELIRG